MNNELFHYGVLGMRWGVRRAKIGAALGSRPKALARTNKMLNKYDRKMQKHLLKIQMNRGSAFESNNYKAKHYMKAKHNAEAAAYVYDKMSTTFSNMTLNTLANRQGVSYGERYVAWRMYTDED